MNDKQQLSAIGEHMREMEECKQKKHSYAQVMTWAGDYEKIGGHGLIVEMLKSYAGMLGSSKRKPEFKVPDAKPRFCESVMRSIPEPEAKPSIEQLMQTYTDRAHSVQLANEHLATCTEQANEAKEALSVACRVVGFDISPITAKQEPELVITNRSQLELGDVIWLSDSTVKENNELTPSGEYTVVKVGVIGVESDGQTIYPDFSTRGWRFIRRP